MNQTRLTVGVLGGMGPEATIDFMADVLRLTHADTDQEHIHLIVDQNPAVPNRQDAIRRGSDEVGAALAEMARRLAAAGADFLVMPCNSAHAFEQAIVQATSLPFVSIIDASVEALGNLCRQGDRVAVMATDGLVASGLYQRALEHAGYEVLLPDSRGQAQLMALIHRIKSGDKGHGVMRGTLEVGRTLTERGAQAVLAACTEIPLVLGDNDLPVPLVSSTEALAARTVELALRKSPLAATRR